MVLAISRTQVYWMRGIFRRSKMEKKSLRKIKKWIIAAAIFTQTLGSAYGNLNFQAGAMEDGTFLLTVNGSISW